MTLERTRIRMLSLGLGGLFLVLSGLNLWRLTAVPRGIWWTPAELAAPLADTRDAFEIRINGLPLEQHLRDGSLRVSAGPGEVPVSAAMVRVRVNHEDSVRASRIPAILASAVAAGAALAGLLLGLVLARPQA